METLIDLQINFLRVGSSKLYGYKRKEVLKKQMPIGNDHEKIVFSKSSKWDKQTLRLADLGKLSVFVYYTINKILYDVKFSQKILAEIYAGAGWGESLTPGSEDENS